nr:hypothetical protein [Tanacetum cinerariifolium]
PITRMADDLMAASRQALAGPSAVNAVVAADPRILDGREEAADDLGLHPDVAHQLRAIAAAELMAQGVLPGGGTG